MVLDLDITRRHTGRLLAWLVAFELFLAVVYLAEGWAGHARHPVHRFIHLLFNLDGEANLVAWFSSIQLFAIGAVCLVLAFARNAAGPPPRGFFIAAALLFIALSADEAGTIHENLSKTLRMVEWMPRFRNEQGLWLPVYGAIGLVVAALAARPMLGVWRAAPRETMTVALGLALAVFGLAGLEIFGYEFLEEAGDPMPYRIEVALEEMCEMAGMSIVLCGITRFALRRLADPSRRNSAREPIAVSIAAS